MKVLLDTHIALWAITDHPRLSAKARSWITDSGNELIVSTVSIWEIAIKHALARGDMPVSAEKAWRFFEGAGYILLDVRPAHAVEVERLPPIHQDPFDRLLLAQAKVEKLLLLTGDSLLARYGAGIEMA